MLPSSVESKVEQYLNRICPAPRADSHSSAASDCRIASAAGIVRDLSATTTAWAAPGPTSGPGTPISCTVAMPWRTSMLARSVAPVKSSAMQPSRSDAGDAGDMGAVDVVDDMGDVGDVGDMGDPAALW